MSLCCHWGLRHLYLMGSNCIEGAVCGPLEQGLNINNTSSRNLQGGPIQRMMMSWGIFNSQKSTHSPRTIFYLICAKLLADSMTGECFNYRERWKAQEMLQTLISSARKNGLAKKTQASKGCLKKKILFFSLGGREKTTTVGFSVSRKQPPPFPSPISFL